MQRNLNGNGIVFNWIKELEVVGERLFSFFIPTPGLFERKIQFALIPLHYHKVESLVERPIELLSASHWAYLISAEIDMPLEPLSPRRFKLFSRDSRALICHVK